MSLFVLKSEYKITGLPEVQLWSDHSINAPSKPSVSITARLDWSLEALGVTCGVTPA